MVLLPSFVHLGAYVDTDTMGDTWATVGSCAQIGKNCHFSGGAGIGGEATWQAARALRSQVLETAGVMLQSDPETLEVADGWVVDRDGGGQRLGLDDLARTVYYRANELPHDHQPELMATRHFRVKDYPFVFTHGVQASWLEVDIETGQVRILNFVLGHDIGTVINPMIVEGQVFGGIAHGVGNGLFEWMGYDER